MGNSSTHSKSKLENAARNMRHANEAGSKADPRRAVDAQQVINRPDQAKGRPAVKGPSNAGRDGGA